MRVYNMESARSGRPVANQFVIVDDNKLVFQSYDSMIVTIDKATSTITFGKDWNYSTTTSKYRNQFLDMYFPKLDSLRNQLHPTLPYQIQKHPEHASVLLNQ